MKKIAKYILTPLLLVGVGCSDFGDIDKNPNASETPLTSALLSNALNGVGGASAGAAGSFSAGLYAQYFSETQYTDNSIYAPQDINWAGEMQGSMMDFQTIIDINSNEATAATAALNGANASQIAIARIMKAYRFSLLTDRYGDIPYFEALKGNPQPVFNTQEEVYTDLFKELAEAVDQFDVNGATVKGDLVYGGDITKWRRFANSLRLILALRLSEVAPQVAQTQAAAAVAATDGVMASNEDNFVISWPGSPFNNPWFALGADQGVSKTIGDIMNATSDPRRPVFASKLDAGGNIVGIPYGLSREEAIKFTAANPDWGLILNGPNRAQASDQYIITYADTELALAEAAMRSWVGTPADVDTHYNAGIAASFEQWGVYDDADYTAYITHPSVEITDASPAGDMRTRIATQRWLTFYPNGTQGWSEWRRTNVPVLVPTPFAVNTSKQIPVRFPYPSVEYTYNPVNVEAAASNIGGDRDDVKVWWDAN